MNKKIILIIIAAVLCLACLQLVAFAGAAECTEHSFGEYISDGNATCREDGTKTAVCTVCGVEDTVTDLGSREGHSMESRWEKDRFEHWKNCRECGLAIEASYGAHTYAVTHEREATRNSEGLDRYECTFCHYSFTESVPKLTDDGIPTGAVVAIAIVGVTLALLILLLAFKKPSSKRTAKK